jgi:hypothetical protein
LFTYSQDKVNIMSTHRTPTSFSSRAALALILTAACLAGSAQAQERRGFEGHDHDFHGHEMHEPYQASHWVFDDRHGHSHYYPVLGYSVTDLPGGYLTLAFGGRHLFFRAGVWYEPGPVGYVVVRPPLGIVVPVLPPDYTTLWVGRVPYYYANDVYYTAGQGGYVVTNPPSNYVDVPPAAPASSAAPAPAPGSAPGAVWYFCRPSGLYYPYAQSCAEGWIQVPAAPAPRR